MAAFAVPPVGWSAAFLDTAFYLDLHVEPSHHDTAPFLATLIQRVIATDGGRKNQRGAAGMAKIRQAIDAIIGGVLRAWSRDGSPAYRSNHADAFTPVTPRHTSDTFDGAALKPGWRPQVVGRRVFTAVIAALKTQGLLHHKVGLRLPLNAPLAMGQGNKSRSSRYWPTTALLDLAQAHGLTAATIAKFFPAPRPKRALKRAALVQLKPLGRKPRASRHDAVEPADLQPPSLVSQWDQADVLRRLVAEVDEHNAFAARSAVTAPADILCFPPQWCRIFRGHWDLQGRWYAIGGHRHSGPGQLAAYSNLPAHQRAQLQINGEAIIELDASASHLSLLLGSTASWPPMIDLRADPYTGIRFLGQPLHRDVVKQYVVEACGKGRPPQRWSSKLVPDHPARAYRPGEIGPAILERYPVLRDPTVVIPPDLVAKTGRPANKLVTHYLAGLEAQALTRAMRWLRMRGILALPVHDSLIVPASAAREARLAMQMGYAGVCGLEPAIREKDLST
jgi:hypothetical protein